MIMGKETCKTIRNFETLYELKRKKLIKFLKQKRLSMIRCIEFEKDVKDFLEIEKTLLYLYCHDYEIGGENCHEPEDEDIGRTE